MTITDKAFTWFKDELNLEAGDNVQFFVRYGGFGQFQSGFSLGIAEKAPDEPAVSTDKEGVTFYVETKDEWYFDGKSFQVNYSDDKGEITYDHEENNKDS